MVHVGGVKCPHEVAHLRLQELGALEVALLADGVDHLNIVGTTRAEDDCRFTLLPDWLARVPLMQLLDSHEGVLAFNSSELEA